MRCLLLLLVGLGWSFLVQAQTARFRVLDAQTGASIPVAKLVNAQGIALASATSDGLLNLLRDGLYILAPGYKPALVSASTGAVVRLAPLSNNLPEVVAEGIRPQTFSLQDLEVTDARGMGKLGTGQAANLGQDIPYLVQQTPSAVTTSDAGTGIGYTSLRVRGSDATRTNVTLDGIPVNDAESQGTYFVDLPDMASSVSKVTVVRGVGSSTSGPGAFGAGLLLQTRQPSDTAFITADNSVGSFGTRRHSFQVGTGQIGKGFSAEARLSRVASDGYVDRATADLYSYMGVVRYKNARGFTARLLHTSGREKTYQAWYGVEKGQADTMRTYNSAGTDFGQKTSPYNNETDNYRQDYWQLHLGTPLGQGWKTGGALFYTFGEGYYEQYKVHDGLGNYGIQTRDSVPPASDLVRRRWLRNHYFGATGTLNYDTGCHNLTIGALASRYLGESFGRIIWAQSPLVSEPDKQYYHNNSQKSELSGFVKYTYTLPNGFSVFGDIQLRALDYRIAGTESGLVQTNLHKTFLFANPKVGVGYDAGTLGRFFFSTAVAHREPTRTTFTDSRGGQDPQPEKLIDYELGYQTRIGKVRPEVTLYYMDYYHQLVQTGQLNDVGNAIFKNIDRSYRAGAELQLTYKPNKQWVVGGSVTLSQNKLKAYTDTLTGLEGERTPVTYTNKAIAYSPAVTAQGRISWMPTAGLEATLLGRYVGKQYLDNRQDGAYSLAAYTVVDARFAYRINPKKWAQVVQITLQINNIANAKYSNNGYVYLDTVYIYPQAGRNFLAGLTLSF